MAEVKFYLLKEFCDYEGEQWLFYINAEKNKNNIELLKKLQNRLNTMDINQSNFDEKPFDLDLSKQYRKDEFEEAEIMTDDDGEDIEKNSYMDEINVIDSELDSDKLKLLLDKNDEGLFDELYKGGILKFTISN